MKIYKANEIKKWDEYTIKNEPVTSIELMERAAIVFVKNLVSHFHFSKPIIVCGTGNNGGDGYAIARLLIARKIPVTVLSTGAPKSENAIVNFNALPSDVIKRNFQNANDLCFDEFDVIIDALFGIGLNGKLRGINKILVDGINLSPTKTIAVDVPSGYDADRIQQQPGASIIKAHSTITFQSLKLGYLFQESENYTGNLQIVNIGLHENFQDEYWAETIEEQDLHKLKFSTFSNKGSKGKLLIIGSFENSLGASILASKAAFKSGCGYVYTHCNEKGLVPLMQHLPECIYVSKVAEDLTHFSAIAIGMGLGKSDIALSVLKKVLRSKKPLIIDADALNLIAENPKLLKIIPKNSILTPHKIELERLLNCENCEDEELLEMQKQLSLKHKLFILQKGKFSKITTPKGELFINTTGNSGMAVAGMGDVLSGIIGSLLAQGYSPSQALCKAVYVHGKAGDELAYNFGKIGILPSDIIEKLPYVLNAI